MQQRREWRFVYLDWGRALACLLVVVYHAAGTASMPKYFGEHDLSDIASFAYVRMPFFFVMSGFLLSWLYLDPARTRHANRQAARFVAKRALRLYPLYWLVLCSVAALQIFVLGQADSVPTGLQWIKTVLLLPQQADGPSGVGGTGAPVIYPAWVLQFELVGYGLIALAIAQPWLRRAYWIGFPVFFLLFEDSPVFALRFLGSQWLLLFWMGAVAARVAQSMQPEQSRRAVVAAALWLTGVAVLQFGWGQGHQTDVTDMNIGFGIGFGILMVGLSGFRSDAASYRPGIVSRGATRLSVWSYAIFLCHAPVISLACKLVAAAGFEGSTGWELAMASSLLLSIALGAMLYGIFEHPVDVGLLTIVRTVRAWVMRVAASTDLLRSPQGYGHSFAAGVHAAPQQGWSRPAPAPEPARAAVAGQWPVGAAPAQDGENAPAAFPGRPRCLTLPQRAMKRGIDVAGALLFFVLFGPLYLLVALAVLVNMGAPIHFWQNRVGRGGERFRFYKFRSMVPDADAVLARHLSRDAAARAQWDAYQKLDDDPRVNAFGRVIRRLSLDELPQFWNVLKGDMSLVGPRPCMERQRSLYGRHWRHYCNMRPGLTGLWQVSGRNRLRYAQRVELDTEYVENWSIMLDLRILAKTVRTVLTGEGSR